MDEKILSLVISVIALIFSIGTTVISLRLQTNSRRRSIREQLSNIMQSISKTLEENLVIWSTQSSQQDGTYHQKLGSIARRLETLCHQAVHLLSEEPQIAHHADYAILAQALISVNNIPKAEECWKKAIEIAPTDFDRLSNMRGYADFLFQQGRHEQGRTLYQKAVEILANDTDFNKFTNAYTHQMNMISEAMNITQPYNNAKECYKKSRALYESISTERTRKYGLSHLGAAYKSCCPENSDSATSLETSKELFANRKEEIANFNQ